MQPNRKARHGIVYGMVGLLFLLAYPATSFSQNRSTSQRALQVGVIAASPLYMKRADGRWGGFSVELWEAVAEYLNMPFEFREFSSLGLLLDALEKHEIDVFPSLPVEERFESKMDYTHSYLKSGLSIAVPAESVEYRWLLVFKGIFSKQILKAVGSLLLLSLIAGLLVWSFERRKNDEMFGDGNAGGIGHGIWWAIVTMTTVGYGDKAPKTIGGRIVALIWMLFSIIFIAIFTANITTSLIINELRGKVRSFNDLYHAKVGSLSQSEGFDFLAKQGVAVIAFESVEEGLTAVANRKIDAFVQNGQVLKYQTKRAFPGRVHVLSGTYDEYFVSMALSPNSPLRKPINRALLKLMRTKNWTEMCNRYFQ